MIGLGTPGTGIHLGIGTLLGTMEAIMAVITHIMDIAAVGTETTGMDTVVGMLTTTGHHTSALVVPLQLQEETVWVQGLRPIVEPVQVMALEQAAVLPEPEEKSAGRRPKVRI